MASQCLPLVAAVITLASLHKYNFAEDGLKNIINVMFTSWYYSIQNTVFDGIKQQYCDSKAQTNSNFSI